MKFLLLFPDGIGLRNFVLTHFLSNLSEKGDVLVWHALPEGAIQHHVKTYAGRVRWEALPHHREGQLPFFFRRAKSFAQLYWQDQPGTDVLLKQIVGQGKNLYRLRNQLSEVLGRAFSHSHSQILSLNKAHAWFVERLPYFKNYLDFLRKERPNIVFCSHQRSETAVPAMLAAGKLGIPTATFIYSWDNLPKGRMAVQADYFLVWSEHMRDEMHRYYPDVSPERVFIIGTPQFENYFNPSLVESRSEFFQRLGLNPLRSAICFSGDDFTTSPYDPQYLADLAQGLRSILEDSRPQIIFRRAPTDVTHRYDAILESYPEIVESRPAWIPLVGEDWSKVIPTEEDSRLLVNIVKHCDLVVNLGSTMGLDFAILDKPTVFVAYQPQGSQLDSRWNIDDVYRLPHFETVHRLQPVYWARSKEELIVTVLRGLEYPDEKRHSRNEWIRTIARAPLDQASQRCVQALIEIAQKNGSA